MHQLWQARLVVTAAVVLWISPLVWAESPGEVRGIVRFLENGGAVHGAIVLLVGPGLVALTDEQGEFVIDNVPAGTYEILAQREHLTATRQLITVVCIIKNQWVQVAITSMKHVGDL